MLYDYSKNRKLSRYFHNVNLQAGSELKRYTNARVKIYKDGQWERVKLTLDNLAKYIATSSRAGQIASAKEFKKQIERNIKNGGASFGFPALSTHTIKLKGKRGQQTTMFNATRTYANSIILKETLNVVRVGVKPQQRNNIPGSNLTVMEYATILEYGSSSRGIPARPLWRRTWHKMGGAKAIKENIRWHLSTRLRILGFK